MMDSATLLDYLPLADTLLKSETKRFESYLTWQSIVDKLRHEFMKEILVKNQQALIAPDN